ncbi:MAG: hypothetical protein VZR37_01685 [Bifidobacterium merycicum]|uniref:hypothetical protein n=1 Tax=Bifidobacterium merycicum TaxID=78345 RepID=UPI0023F520C2|nr:hypothetical protein [Bifidobacterium merycicum]MEE1294035.1 hypothetical protein [Bifidobacterium merycicum]MEE3341405.1 hypothetical protein [Bifidobacterium merycicum]
MTENATSAVKKQGSMKYVVILALSAGMAGLLYGYDTVSISGAIEFLRQAYNLSAGLQGLVISSIMIGGVVGVGSPASSPIRSAAVRSSSLALPASSSQPCGPPSPTPRGP